LLELKKVEPEYIAPIHVFLLQQRETREQRLAVYRNGRHLPAEAAVLQRLFEEHALLFPDDAALLSIPRLELPASLPLQVIETAQTFSQKEEKLRELKARLEEEKERRGTTQDEGERQVKNAFERAITKGPKNLLEMRATSGTHQKNLIGDRKFAVAGSFNWLSYVGERDEGYRDETSVLLRQPEAVNKLATIALQAFPS
jgi:hypothetical protein